MTHCTNSNCENPRQKRRGLASGILVALAVAVAAACGEDRAASLEGEALVFREVHLAAEACSGCKKVRFENAVTESPILAVRDRDALAIPLQEIAELEAVIIRPTANRPTLIRASLTFSERARSWIREYRRQGGRSDPILIAVRETPVEVVTREELGSSIRIGDFRDLDEIAALLGRSVAATREATVPEDPEFSESMRASKALRQENEEFLDELSQHEIFRDVPDEPGPE